MYETLVIPDSYKCSRCNLHGVKLWRQYNTFVAHLQLLCWKCADPNSKPDNKGYVNDTELNIRTDQLNDKIGCTGSLVPAVITEEGTGFWGYTSVPVKGCAWWRALPTSDGDMLGMFMLSDKEVKVEKMIEENNRTRAELDALYKRDTIFMVEATNYEKLCLWEKHCSQSLTHRFPTRTVIWESLHGMVYTIGYLRKRPIVVSVSWQRIDGHIVMFYEPISALVDWKMIRSWLEKEFSHVKQQCDAMNFHNCLAYLRKFTKTTTPEEETTNDVA